MKIVFLDVATVQGADLRPLFDTGNHLVQLYPTTSPAELLDRLANVDIVITNKVVLDRGVLAQLPHLKLICIAATGTNCVDLAAAQDFGIAVSNARDYALDSVPQHAMALLLALSNQIVNNHQAVMAGAWQQSPIFCLHQYPLRSLHGKTLTVLGYGGLGAATAALATAFGMHICIAERPDVQHIRNGRTPFRQALELADVVSLHCPAIAGRGFLLDHEQFAWLKPSALLINTARGQLINPHALLYALQHGRLAGAALDVLIQEPPPLDDPLIQAALPNLLLSPHVAWAADSSVQRLVNQIAENIKAFVSGTSLRSCF